MLRICRKCGKEYILALALAYGYTEEYLSSIWAEMVADGDMDWDFFVGVTMERD